MLCSVLHCLRCDCTTFSQTMLARIAGGNENNFRQISYFIATFIVLQIIIFDASIRQLDTLETTHLRLYVALILTGSYSIFFGSWLQTKKEINKKVNTWWSDMHQEFVELISTWFTIGGLSICWCACVLMVGDYLFMLISFAPAHT